MQERYENLKSIIIHIVVGVILFLVATFIFNRYIGRDKTSPVAELSNSSYPVMEIGNEVTNYNLMYGYQSDIDLSLVRNQYTIVDNSKTVPLRLHNFEYDITAIQYVLFEKNPENPLEEGTINKLEDDASNGIRKGEIVFETELKTGKDYYLQFSIRLDNNTRIYYYSKIQNRAGCHLNDYFEYVKKFHENLFDKEAKDKISPYLEPVVDAVPTNYSTVNIHDTADEVTFGSMEVKEEGEPVYYVKELNDTYAVIRVDCILSSEIMKDVIQYYNVSETYKIRYAPERMYLLDYERSMNAFYNKAVIDSSNNYIGLGIHNDEDIEYVSSNDGYRVSFVEEGQLWYYDYQSSNVTQIYSFSSDSMGDLRNRNKEHGIHILKMDDKGNILYLLYGYMNRGKNEGLNGIQIISFDAETGCNEEIAFLKTSLPYNSMKKDINKLAYLNKDNIFYLVLNGDLHEINIVEKTDQILKSGMIDDSITSSRDHSIIAVEKDPLVTKNREIEVMNLDSGEKNTFTCKEDSRIRAIGFLSEDFIYGIASKENVSKSTAGVVTFPMKKIKVVGIDGQEKKNYSKAGRYVTDTEIKGLVLEMTFAKKSGTHFVQTSDVDYIRYKEEESSADVSLTKKYSDTYGNQLYMKFPPYVYISIEPDQLSTKILTSEDDRTIELSNSGKAQKMYYVYAGGVQAAAYSNLPEAVNEAQEARGNVITSEEETVWQCIFDSYAQVVGMDNVAKVASDKKSLEGCLSMIAAVNGKAIAPKDIDTSKGKVAELMETYSGHDTLILAGCSTDEILYYVSQGCPVLAKYNKSRYVIVMSYNSTKIRYLDPVTGLSTAVSREALTNQFEKYGNVFYSYLP